MAKDFPDKRMGMAARGCCSRYRLGPDFDGSGSLSSHFPLLVAALSCHLRRRFPLSQGLDSKSIGLSQGDNTEN